MPTSTIYNLVPFVLRDRMARVQKQLFNFRTLARGYNQWNTIRDGDCKDCKGEAIPWYTYPAVEYLSHLDLGQLSVFEYGSGNSTLWWSQRVRSVVSIENDPEWYERVTSKLKGCTGDVIYQLQTDRQGYVHSLAREFDITIIDGRYRMECAERFLDVCNNGTMLIFDNSDWYPNTIESIRKSLGWAELDFHGFGPINMYTWTTSIFINPKMLQGIRYKKHLKSIAGLDTNAET